MSVTYGMRRICQADKEMGVFRLAYSFLHNHFDQLPTESQVYKQLQIGVSMLPPLAWRVLESAAQKEICVERPANLCRQPCVFCRQS